MVEKPPAVSYPQPQALQQLLVNTEDHVLQLINSKNIQFGWGTQYPRQQLEKKHVSDRNHTAVAPMGLSCPPLLYRDPNGKHQKSQPLQLISVHVF